MALADDDLALEELQLLRLALEESHGAHHVLLHQQQLMVSATPGASTSSSTQTRATTSADSSHTHAALPSSESPPPAAPAVPAPAQDGSLLPIVGVGALCFMEFPRKKTQQTMRKICAGLGAARSALWREMNICPLVTQTHILLTHVMQEAVRQAMTHCHLDHDKHWTRQNASRLALLYPIVCVLRLSASPPLTTMARSRSVSLASPISRITGQQPVSFKPNSTIVMGTCLMFNLARRKKCLLLLPLQWRVGVWVRSTIIPCTWPNICFLTR
jgi:hypothetical protein